MPSKKIDPTGCYLSFPGITIIAKILDSDRDLWHSIYSLLCQQHEFCSYFSPLPFDSYHMTCINLSTEDEVGKENWSKFLSNHRSFFQSIKQSLQEYAFTPVVTFESIRINGALQLLVSLPQDQVQRIHDIARHYHIFTKVPEVFHITLAYQFKPLDNASLNRLKQHLKQEISSILATHASPLSLTPAILSTFESMEHFSPWDPDTMAMIEPKTSLPCFFPKEALKKDKRLSQSCSIM